jgi:hypothetical protein
MSARIRIEVDTCDAQQVLDITRPALPLANPLRVFFAPAMEFSDAVVVIYSPLTPADDTIYLIRPYQMTLAFLPNGPTETVIVPRVTTYPATGARNLIAPDSFVMHDVFTRGLATAAAGPRPGGTAPQLVGPFYYLTFTVTGKTRAGSTTYRHAVLAPPAQTAPFTTNPITGAACVTNDASASGDERILYINFPAQSDKTSPYFDDANPNAATEAYVWKKISATCPADPGGPLNLFLPVVPSS